MINIKELEQSVRRALEILKDDEQVASAMVFASANQRTVGRLVYTTHFPCNGLEEPKSESDMGIGVEIVMVKDGRKLVGFGHEPNDLSEEAVYRALTKAKRDAVEDPEFFAFMPEDYFSHPSTLPEGYHDAAYMDLAEEKEAELLAQVGWDTITGAVEALKSHPSIVDADGLILNGDNFFIRERMAVGTTGGTLKSDESTVVLTFLTAMIEQKQGKGSAWDVGTIVSKLEAKALGKRAVEAAIRNTGGTRVKSGTYTVVFGPQAVAELVGSLLAPHLNLGMVDFGASLFTGQLGQQALSPLLSIYDDATRIGAAGSKRFTGEGAPTSRVDLVKDGVVAGFLSNYYLTRKALEQEEEFSQKLGASPHDVIDRIAPYNGFRFSLGGGRSAASGVGVNATNLVIESTQAMPNDDVIKNVENGLYIGRLWYTYPIGGFASGIISGTAIADCYKIENGKLTTPILPNTLRLEDNIGRMMKEVIAVGDTAVPTILWASDEITHAPLLAVSDVTFHEINVGS